MVNQLWNNEQDKKALGEIKLPPALREQDYKIHPALLDGCFHMLASIFQRDAGYISLGCKRLTFFGGGHRQLWCEAQIQFQTPEFLTANFRLVAENGELVATVEEFQVKRASNQPLPQKVEKKEKEETSLNLIEQLKAAEKEQRKELLIAHIQSILSRVLGDNKERIFSLSQGFFDLGMDSMTSIELRNRLQNSIGVSLSSTLFYKYPTIETLVGYLSQDVLANFVSFGD